jgi:hypothetical protein
VISAVLTVANDKLRRIDSDKDAAKKIIQEKISVKTRKLEGYYELYADESTRRDIIKRMIDKISEEIRILEYELQEISKGNDEIMSELTLLRDALIKVENKNRIVTPKTETEMIEQISTILITGNELEVRLKTPRELDSVHGMDMDKIQIDDTLDIAQIRALLFDIVG